MAGTSYGTPMKSLRALCELPASRVPTGGNFSVLQSHPVGDPIFLSSRITGVKTVLLQFRILKSYKIPLRLFCALAIVLAAWDHRFAMNSDGISYLDMADAASHGSPAVLLHPYWSPLYPALLAAALKLFAPSAASEVLVVHLVNCCVGLLALAGFAFFESQWSKMRDGGIAGSIFAYSVFLWGTATMIGLELASPDLCTAALIYLAAGLCCQLSSGKTGAALGVALSLAYMAKSAMLPLGVVLLVLLAVSRERRKQVAVAAVVFAGLSGSFIAALSIQQQRFTIGDSGRLNYAWMVQRDIPAFVGWTGLPNGTGTPLHPPRISVGSPELLEFKDTVPGTFPLWANPAYFHEGLVIRFDGWKQAEALALNAKALVLDHGMVGFVMLIGLMFLAIRLRFRVDGAESWMILWSVAACFVYCLVTFQPRYVGPFLVLFWIAAYEATYGPGKRTVLWTVSAFLFLMQLIPIGGALKHALDTPKVPVQLEVAQELTRFGLQPGDEIATIGYPFSVYYARLAKLKVVANIKGSAEPNDAVKMELRRLGVKAIVSPELRSGWTTLGLSNYSLKLLYQSE